MRHRIVTPLELVARQPVALLERWDQGGSIDRFGGCDGLGPGDCDGHGIDLLNAGLVAVYLIHSNQLGPSEIAREQPPRAAGVTYGVPGTPAFDDANREGERPFYWVWIACTSRLMDRKDAAQEAWDRAKEFVNDDLFQKNGIKEVWTAFGNVIGRGHLRLPDLQDWQEESLQLV